MTNNTEQQAVPVAQESGLRAAAKKARAQFQFYADEHGNAGKYEKARTNAGFAEMLELALSEDATQTREAELVAALEPFAEACNFTTADDSESLYDTLAAEKLTWRDLRRARAALNARGGA